MSEMRFDDDVILITGAGRGLGREYALAFAARGAAVVVNDISGDADAPSPADEVVQQIVAAGGRAVAALGSVAQPEDAQAITGAAMRAFGKVTVLVNNAGIIDFAALADITDAAWRRMMAVTLDGTFHMSRALWPHFQSQGHGRIVNTTSNAGFAGNETLVHYGAAKLGVAGFTRALAQECGATDITVNAVAPMAITRMNRDAFFGGSETGGEDWVADIRTGKAPMGPPSAVAPTVLWLAHRSTQVNGEVFSVSSGKVARVGFVIGKGYFDPRHAPEDLRDHVEEVRSLDSPFYPCSTADELALIPPLFGMATDRPGP
jgi:NAD(P)-dependent dehydrogenase (short-subunit alcohol dehydrogenase family)